MMARLADKLAGDPDPSAYRFQLHQADIIALPFEAARFDVIIAVHVLAPVPIAGEFMAITAN